jgi:hypothetical protein
MNEDLDPGELALASIGVTALINDEVPKFGKGKIQAALDIPAELPKLARQLMAGELHSKPAKRTGNYRKLLDRLAKPMSPAEVEALVSRFPPEATDMSGPFVVSCQAAWARLADLFPVSVIESFTGPTNITPTDDVVWKFFNQLQILDDPRRVYELMGSGALLRSQVEALKGVYPTISAAVETSIYEAVASAKAMRSSYQVPPSVDVGIKVFLGRRQIDSRDQSKTPPPPPVPRRTHTGGMANDTATRTQAAIENK